ncbi:hypothetical protein AB0I77_08045 [Streptomyces sp. NPDC050619]|uniref:hypothetical protein n=1 Tax=Streptomyces sp. NPDC050619 TaxID=3157214 RepID=UPI003438232A
MSEHTVSEVPDTGDPLDAATGVFVRHPEPLVAADGSGLVRLIASYASRRGPLDLDPHFWRVKRKEEG